MKILVIEDELKLGKFISSALEQAGYVCDHASDGAKGLELALTAAYDLILLDLMLPRLDGIEVCKRLRNEARKSTPVLMLTARDTLPDKLAGFAAGLHWPWYVVWLGITIMLFVEHRLMKPQDLRHVNTAFFTLNGIISPVVLIGVVLGIYL